MKNLNSILVEARLQLRYYRGQGCVITDVGIKALHLQLQILHRIKKYCYSIYLQGRLQLQHYARRGGVVADGGVTAPPSQLQYHSIC